MILSEKFDLYYYKSIYYFYFLLKNDDSFFYNIYFKNAHIIIFKDKLKSNIRSFSVFFFLTI